MNEPTACGDNSSAEFELGLWGRSGRAFNLGGKHGQEESAIVLILGVVFWGIVENKRGAYLILCEPAETCFGTP